MKALARLLDEEPILTRIGPVIGALVIYLLAKGILDKDTANLIWAVGGAIVGPGALIAARSLVWPDSHIDNGTSGRPRD